MLEGILLFFGIIGVGIVVGVLLLVAKILEDIS